VINNNDGNKQGLDISRFNETKPYLNVFALEVAGLRVSFDTTGSLKYRSSIYHSFTVNQDTPSLGQILREASDKTND